MEDHISKCTLSGLSIRDYCKDNGINVSVYYYWLKRFSKNSTGDFIKVTPLSSYEKGYSVLFISGHKFSFDILPPVDYLKKLLS